VNVRARVNEKIEMDVGMENRGWGGGWSQTVF
jgi:hypothetical protein